MDYIKGTEQSKSASKIRMVIDCDVSVLLGSQESGLLFGLGHNLSHFTWEEIICGADGG